MVDPKHYGKDFTGLGYDDFSADATGTSWRGQRSLAGLVARYLSESRRLPVAFHSTDVKRRNEAFISHRAEALASTDDRRRIVKFRLALDERGAYYGLTIERPHGPMDAGWDWPRFIRAVTGDQRLQRTITQAETGRGALMVAFITHKDEKQGAKLSWDEAGVHDYPVAARLKLLDGLPDCYWIDLHLRAHISRNEAMVARLGVARTMASFLADLLPIYAAALPS